MTRVLHKERHELCLSFSLSKTLFWGGLREKKIQKRKEQVKGGVSDAMFQ